MGDQVARGLTPEQLVLTYLNNDGPKCTGIVAESLGVRFVRIGITLAEFLTKPRIRKHCVVLGSAFNNPFLVIRLSRLQHGFQIRLIASTLICCDPGSLEATSGDIRSCLRLVQIHMVAVLLSRNCAKCRGPCKDKFLLSYWERSVATLTFWGIELSYRGLKPAPRH